jgi:hypothetical protein
VPLSPPPRDLSAFVIPHDHREILADNGVIRRISHQQLVTDAQTGRTRISSMAFKPSAGLNGGMSVDLQASIERAGLDARLYVTTPRWTGSLRFDAGALRAEGFQVGYDPLPDNPHHGEVWGTFSKPKQRRLSQLAVWFVPIEGVTVS